ncbi:MAG: hypothetical protein SVM80_10975 [Halobacteriota archaeon]|nr:hypothetical protein [Halobacteriota archaeon]
MTDEKMIVVCPHCGSSGLYYEAGGYMGKMYHCKNCDYVGAFVLEANEKMVEAIKDRPVPKKEHYTTLTFIKLILLFILIILVLLFF